jgi:hypothetical protein
MFMRLFDKSLMESLPVFEKKGKNVSHVTDVLLRPRESLKRLSLGEGGLMQPPAVSACLWWFAWGK